MSLFRYPVRPLSELGKVLLCVAMSLLAALLLLVSPPTHAAQVAPSTPEPAGWLALAVVVFIVVATVVARRPR
jgi:uncharacterized membrane protein YjfL (UPF0719 family)